MKTLWYLSWAVLVLGNIIDGCATFYHLLFEISREGSLPALWTWQVLGLSPAAVLVKFVLLHLILLLIWWLPTAGFYPPWVGIRLSTFFGFFEGILLALGGTGILSAVALKLASTLFPVEFVLARWEVLPTIFWVAATLVSGIAMGAATAVLLILNDRRLASEK